MDTKKKLIDLKQQLIQKTGGKLNIETEVRLGSFFPELETVCEHIKPYTVVMGEPGNNCNRTPALWWPHSICHETSKVANNYSASKSFFFSR